jgi:hypothetical protein
MPGLGLRFCHTKDQKIIGKGPAGDKRFGPVHHILIPLQNRCGSDRGDITPCIRLRDRRSGDRLSLHQGRHPFLLLLLRPEEENDFRTKRARQDKMGNSGIHPPEFLVDEAVLQEP